jgi:hypothetical protein
LTASALGASLLGASGISLILLPQDIIIDGKKYQHFFPS